MAEVWTRVGSLRKGKTGNLYIKLEKDVTLTATDVLQLQDPRKVQKTLVEKGKISAEEADARIAKIPEYVRYDVVLPPRNK
jgi:hypothetical protein